MSAGPPGPAVTTVRVQGIPVPQLAGHPSANAVLRSIGHTLRGSCRLVTERDDPRLASFVWSCRPAGVTSATFSLADDRRLTLPDLLTGDYRAYLSSVGSAQLAAQGAGNTSAGDLTRWSLTPNALQIVFPGGAVLFPIATLRPYILESGPLGS